MKRMVLATILTLASLGAASAEGTLRIATEGAFPPFNNISADGEPVGFDVDIAKALCAQMTLKCEIVAQDWDGIIPGLVNNKYDAIIASMSITEERKQAIDFTNPYYTNYLSVVAKQDAGISLDNLGEHTLGTQRSTLGSQWAEDKFGRRGDIKLYDTYPSAFSDLQAGRIDAVVVDYLVAAEWLKQNPGFAFAIDKIDVGDKIGIGVRKGDTDLTNAFNGALDALRADGTYQKISEAYFSADIY